MKLLSGKAFIGLKKFLCASFAVAAVGLSPVALAETNVMAHAETASALRCLLGHGQNGCAQVFVSGARLTARSWVGHNPNRDFELGALVSAEYALTKTGENVYIARLLNRRTTDIYDVKFRNQEMTFYIARPQPNGKIDHLLIRNGSPDPVDERMDMFVRGPG